MDLQWPRVVSNGAGTRDDDSPPPSGNYAIVLLRFYLFPEFSSAAVATFPWL